MRVFRLSCVCLVCAAACTSDDEYEEFEQALERIDQELDSEGRPMKSSEEPAAEPTPEATPERTPEPAPEVVTVPPGVEVKGGLSAEAVQRVVAGKSEEIESCYRDELAEKLSIAGAARLTWIIAETGQVERVKVRKATISIVNVAECLRATIKTWEFPKPEGGGVVEVDYPFNFQPS